MPTQSKPVSIKLDADTQERIKRLATSRERSAHWLMREAISQYVEREELRETFHRDTLVFKDWQKQLKMSARQLKYCTCSLMTALICNYRLQQ